MQDTSMVTQQLLERIREQPVINYSPLPEYDYDHLDYGMTQSIERTQGGRLWSCWVGGRRQFRGVSGGRLQRR